MSGSSKIEWTGYSWNPIRARLKELLKIPAKHLPLSAPSLSNEYGLFRIVPAGTFGYHCERVSPGCKNCYACTMNGRTLPAWGTGLDYTRQSRDKVEIYLDEAELEKPLHWRKPRKIFPCSMTDWCAEFVTDEMRDRMLAVCALTPHHTYQFLTKRAAEMRAYLSSPDRRESVEDAGGLIPGVCYANTQAGWPPPNCWFGVSVEDQQRAQRIVELLRTPAALRWVSYEPALGPVDFTRIKTGAHIREFMRKMAVDTGRDPEKVLQECAIDDTPWRNALNGDWFDGCDSGDGVSDKSPKLDWLVAGGESGPGARPCDLAWLRSARDQCAAAGVPCFIKQLGARPFDGISKHRGIMHRTCEENLYLQLRDRKGGEPAEWPADLCVREMPAAAGARA